MCEIRNVADYSLPNIEGRVVQREAVVRVSAVAVSRACLGPSLRRCSCGAENVVTRDEGKQANEGSEGIKIDYCYFVDVRLKHFTWSISTSSNLFITSHCLLSIALCTACLDRMKITEVDDYDYERSVKGTPQLL